MQVYQYLFYSSYTHDFTIQQMFQQCADLDLKWAISPFERDYSRPDLKIEVHCVQVFELKPSFIFFKVSLNVDALVFSSLFSTHSILEISASSSLLVWKSTYSGKSCGLILSFQVLQNQQHIMPQQHHELLFKTEGGLRLRLFLSLNTTQFFIVCTINAAAIEKEMLWPLKSL